MRQPKIGLPASPESCSSRVPHVHGVQFSVRHYTGRCYPAYPVRGALPRTDRSRIIHADGLVILNDSTTSFSYVTFQSIARQTFCCSSLPKVAPKILFAFGSLASLNSGGHLLKFIPRCRRVLVTVLSQKIDPVGQNADLRVIRQPNDLAACCVTGDQFWILR